MERDYDTVFVTVEVMIDMVVVVVVLVMVVVVVVVVGGASCNDVGGDGRYGG